MRPRLLAAACLVLAATAACAGNRDTVPSSGPVALEGLPASGSARRAPAAAQPADRAVTQHASLRLVTDSLQRVQRTADSLAVAWGGYVGNAELREKHLRMSLHVPAGRLNEALDRLAALGRATHRTVRRVDVTAQVVDMDARLGTLRAVRERLRAYLQTAAGVNDLIAVERELGRVQGEIDLLEARQRSISTQVDLAQVDLEAERPRVLGPLGWLFTGLATLIEKLFIIR